MTTVQKPQVPDVLATRYASAELVALWSPEEKVRAERRLWLAVLRAQRDVGRRGIRERRQVRRIGHARTVGTARCGRVRRW